MGKGGNWSASPDRAYLGPALNGAGAAEETVPEPAAEKTGADEET